MSLNLSMPEITELKPKILVVGVGGAGGNAVNNMIRSSLEGVDFVVANTDAQSLANSLCEQRIQLGTQITQGLGAGARPDIGAAAAQEAIDHIKEPLAGAHMAFITAGMGGGTGTGAAPVIAKMAREQGILTVGVVTKPFQFEGSRRMAIAEEGVEELQKYVDTLIIIPNQNLFRIANEKTTFADAFAMADNVLHSGVRGITDLMVMPGLINLDFADVRTVMMEMGKAMMGTGEAGGENRAIEAAEAAISNPLLDEVSMKGARGVLINITGGKDLTLFEVDEAANRIRSEVDPDANIIVGSTFDEDLDGNMRVSVFATGIDAEAGRAINPGTVMPFVPRPAEPATAPKLEAKPAAVSQPTAAAAVAASPAEVVALDQSEPAVAAADPEAAELLNLDMEDAIVDDTPAVEVADMAEPAMPDPAEEAPFIAPRAMEVDPDDVPERPNARPTTRPDPFAEAAVTNGSSDREQRQSKGPSLFERMIGKTPKTAEPAVAETRKEPTIESRPAATLKETAPEPEPFEESVTLKTPVPAPAAKPEPAPMPGAAPAAETSAPLTLKSVAGESAPSPRGSEDQIDIPAFLRRQAN